MFFITLIEQIEEAKEKQDLGIIRPLCYVSSIEEIYTTFGKNFEKLSGKGYEYVCIENIDPGYDLNVKSRILYKLMEGIDAFTNINDVLPKDFCFAFLRKGGKSK